MASGDGARSFRVCLDRAVFDRSRLSHSTRCLLSRIPGMNTSRSVTDITPNNRIDDHRTDLPRLNVACTNSECLTHFTKNKNYLTKTFSRTFAASENCSEAMRSSASSRESTAHSSSASVSAAPRGPRDLRRRQGCQAINTFFPYPRSKIFASKG